jgi:Tfp pilus assembly protein PilF
MSRRCLRHPKVVLLVLAAVVLLMVGGGAVAWMYRQARNKRILLEAAAAAAETAGDWAAVESALRRYARLQGDDAQTCQRIGHAIETGAVDEQDRRRALPFYAKAISLDPQNNVARLGFAELLVGENPVEAVKSADMVLQRQPDSADAWRVKALGLTSLLAGSDAAVDRLLETHQALDTALRLQPGHLRLASQVAEFNRRYAARLAAALRKPPAEFEAAAATALDRLVEHADDEAEARLTRLLFQRRLGKVNSDDRTAKEDLQRLVALRPSSNVVRLLAAGWSAGHAFPEAPRRGGVGPADPPALADAQSQLQAAIQNRPDDPVPYWSQAQLQWWCGEREAAVETLEQGRQAVGAEHLILNLRLAELQLAEGRWADAESTLRTLDKITADSKPLAVAHPAAAPAHAVPAANGEVVPSVDLRPIVDLLWVQWWLAVGNPAADPARALPLLDQYAEDSLRPGLRGLAVYLRGRAFASLGRWEEAAEAFLRATQFVDGTVLPRLGAAYAFYRLGRYRDASSQYRYAVALLQQRKSAGLNQTQIWLEIAHCAIAEQSQRPAWKRDWRSFQEAAARVGERLSKSPIPLFLQLEAARWNVDPEVRAAAESQLPAAERAYGEQAEFWALLAADRLRINDLQGAEQAIQSWEQKTGRTAHDFRAELALADGDPEAADRAWQAASASLAEHQQRQYLTRRVQTALQSGCIERARALLEAWLSAHPADALSQFELAQIAWAVGDVPALQKSAAALRQIEGEAGRRWQIVRTQSLFMDASGTSDAAAKQKLERACSDLVARFPEDRQIRVLQGLAAEATGQPREAVKAWRQAVAWGEQNPGILLRLAARLHDQGQSREALELCLSLSAAATDCRAATLAARILTTAVVNPHEQEQAEEIFRTILAGTPRPDLPLLLLNLAVLREYQGRPEEAVALTRQALQQQPQAVELKNNLAWFLTAYLNDQATAQTLVEQAIQTAGPLPPLLDTQGVVLLAAGKLPEAIRALEASTQGDLVPAARFLHLAEAYQQAGRNEDVQRLLTRAEQQGVSGLAPRDRRAYLRLKAQI